MYLTYTQRTLREENRKCFCESEQWRRGTSMHQSASFMVLRQFEKTIPPSQVYTFGKTVMEFEGLNYEIRWLNWKWHLFSCFALQWGGSARPRMAPPGLDLGNLVKRRVCPWENGKSCYIRIDRNFEYAKLNTISIFYLIEFRIF